MDFFQQETNLTDLSVKHERDAQNYDRMKQGYNKPMRRFRNNDEYGNSESRLGRDRYGGDQGSDREMTWTRLDTTEVQTNGNETEYTYRSNREYSNKYNMNKLSYSFSNRGDIGNLDFSRKEARQENVNNQGVEKTSISSINNLLKSADDGKNTNMFTSIDSNSINKDQNVVNKQRTEKKKINLIDGIGGLVKKNDQKSTVNNKYTTPNTKGRVENIKYNQGQSKDIFESKSIIDRRLEILKNEYRDEREAEIRLKKEYEDAMQRKEDERKRKMDEEAKALELEKIEKAKAEEQAQMLRLQQEEAAKKRLEIKQIQQGKCLKGTKDEMIQCSEMIHKMYTTEQLANNFEELIKNYINEEGKITSTLLLSLIYAHYIKQLLIILSKKSNDVDSEVYINDVVMEEGTKHAEICKKLCTVFIEHFYMSEYSNLVLLQELARISPSCKLVRLNKNNNIVKIAFELLLKVNLINEEIFMEWVNAVHDSCENRYDALTRLSTLVQKLRPAKPQIIDDENW